MSSFSATISLAMIVLAGLLLRGYQLVDPSLWYDEAFSHLLSSEMTWQEMIATLRQDVHPPLYFILLKCWVGIFGDSIASIRSLSVIAGGMSIVVCYLFTRSVFLFRESEATSTPELRARSAGLAAAAILAVCSPQIRWSQDAKMYSVATALIFLSSWLLVEAMCERVPRTRQRWLWAGWILTTAATLYTHNYALFTFLAQILFVVSVQLTRSEMSFRRLVRCRVSWRRFLAIAATIALYLPWLPTLLTQSERVKSDYWIPKVDLWSIPYNLDALLFPATSYAVSHYRAVAIIVGILVVVAWLACQKRLGNALVVLLMLVPLACAAGVSVLLAGIVTPRYFLFAASFFGTGLTVAIWRALPVPVAACISVVAVSNLAVCHYEYVSSFNIAEHPGTRGAVEQALKFRKPGEELVVTNAGIYFSVKYYAAGMSPVKLLRSDQDLPHYLGGSVNSKIDSVSIGELDDAENDRCIIIDSTGFGIVPEAHSSPSRYWIAEAGSARDFPEIFDWQGTVTVAPYRRHRPSEPQLHARTGGRRHEMSK